MVFSMRIPINLASQPFRRDRAVLVASGALGVLLIVLLVFLLSLNRLESGQAAETRREIARLDSKMHALSVQQARQDAILRQPENAEVLERSLFLNALLYRKGISWTRIFADLEQVVPYNVRIMAIRPSVTGPNQISLDMSVGSETPLAVIELLKNLENSPRFGAVYSHSELPPTQTDKLYRCRVSVNYVQKL
jgi:type IV pilus assembly protein PilN